MIKFKKEVNEYIKENFYKITNKQGYLVYHRNEDGTTVNFGYIQSLVRKKIDKIDDEDAVNAAILSTVPMIRKVIYKPIIGSSHLIDRSAATLDYNLNTYKPSAYQGKKLEREIPPVFDAYFKRLFPNDDIRKGVLYWLAGLVHKPDNVFGFAPVLVGDSGTGKSFLIDHIVKPLIGDTNYQRISMHQLKGKFDIGMSTRSLIYCDELQCGAQNNLLSYIGNKTITIEEKGKDVTTELVTASFVFSSNKRAPFESAENLYRRLKLLPYIEHKDSMHETSVFIGELVRFIDKDDGLSKFSSYLLGLANQRKSNSDVFQLLTVKREMTLEDKTLKAVIEAGDIVFTENLKVELGLSPKDSSHAITRVLKINGYSNIGSRINQVTGKKSRCWRRGELM